MKCGGYDMRKFYKVLVLSVFLITGCTSTQTTYLFDKDGHITSKIVNSQTDVNAVASKNRAVIDDSIECKLSVSMTDSSTYTPTVDMFYRSGKKAYVSVEDPSVLPDVVSWIMKTNEFFNLTNKSIKVSK